MAGDREQQKKVTELIGEGSTRRIRLIVFASLALSGIVLQGLVYWYAARMAMKNGVLWGCADLGIRIWRVDADRRLACGALATTPEGHASRGGPGRIAVSDRSVISEAD